MNRLLRWLALFIIVLSLSGCMDWIRAYQTYLQLSDFDEHFSFSVLPNGDFALNFKDPILLSEDFVSLSKLYATDDVPTKEGGRRWRYLFRKVDAQGKIIQPEISFYADLVFNKDKKIISGAFSSVFLQMAPQKFLEASLRAVGGGKIDKDKRELRANPEGIEKIADQLPKKPIVLAKLGAPLQILNEPEKEIYVYHFLLDTHLIEKGYEDRAQSEVNIHFDKKTQDLIRMSGTFAGLHASINYRKYQKNPDE